VASIPVDGTIFTVDNNTIVGINPTTGQPQFSPVAFENGLYTNDGDCGEFQPIYEATPPAVGQAIIAGDGYAYYPYYWTVSKIVYGCQNEETTHSEGHSRIMRVGADGSASEIKVADWAKDTANGVSSGYVPTGPPLGTLIANEDQGVLYSWSLCLSTPGNPCTAQFTSVTNGSLSTVATGVGAGSSVFIQPILQRTDGSYVGTVYTGSGTAMMAFTSSGQQLWNQPGCTPQIATIDGGVIAQSSSGQSVTFDTNGDQTGQTSPLSPNLTQYSGGQWPGWLGNSLGSSYAISFGTATSLASTTIDYANTYAALLGGNHSGTSVSAQQEWFPPLPTCPGATTPCAKEALVAARDSLVVKLVFDGGCPNCWAEVFSKLPSSSSQRGFASYMGLSPTFLDGTRSNAPTVVLCGNPGGISGPVSWGFCAVGSDSGTVSTHMARKQESAVTETPSDAGLGLLTFFDPRIVCTSTSGNKRILNEALLFHEGLHGYSGYNDGQLLGYFGKDPLLASVNITYYIQDNVLGGDLAYVDDSSRALQCPN
jgi:hypothetical protein